MSKITIILFGLISAMLFVGICTSQGMGSSRAYDQSGYDYMGTPIASGDKATVYIPDYLSPSGSQRSELYPQLDPLGTGNGAQNLQLNSIDPTSEGLAVVETEKLSNQLYLQRGQDLLTEGTVTLGEPHVLWARVIGKGNLILYDFNSQILNQGYITPGWYKITGAYADYPGQHIYRFVSAGQSSNNLTIIVDSGSYPTSFSLTGRVLDQSGQGIAGVKVIAINSEGGKFSTTTGPAGYYAIDVATGAYLVNAEYPGYVFTSSSVQAIAGMVSAARPIVGTASSTVPLGA